MSYLSRNVVVPRASLLRSATAMPAVVSTVTKASSIPPRWDAAMRTDDGREVVVRVGPAKRDDVLPGSRVSILLPDGRTDSAALESQRPRESPTHIGPFVVTSIFFVGLAMLAFAIFLAVRGSTV